MNKNSRIFVAGHRGLAGSAITRALKKHGYTNIHTRDREELDLLDPIPVEEFFRTEKPEYVFLAAAKVGGILANKTYPADFIYQNLRMQLNVIHNAWATGVRKLLFLGSSCIYPRDCPQPIKEEYLLSGPLEPTNEPYAVAKIAGIKMIQAYNRQYGADFINVMPTNLYGINDNFDLANSHVLPALLRKTHEAKQAGDPHVVVWGSGSPRREFMFVDDMAEACVFLMENYSGPEIINIGVGRDVTIRELAETIKEVTGFDGGIKFDTSKPDGTPRKLMDVSRLDALGWRAPTDLRTGIARTYEWYVSALEEGTVRL
ncbi:MAG: GDP-L-fucose synthase family protein [Candidatus Nitrospinota bacterium M3_3B_026]